MVHRFVQSDIKRHLLNSFTLFNVLLVVITFSDMQTWHGGTLELLDRNALLGDNG